MANKKFTINLKIDNIGPHSGQKQITFSHEVDSNKAIFYATNGTGKSFISRAFRVAENVSANNTTNDLLTLGMSKGALDFKIISDSIEKSLSVVIEKDKAPVVTNTSGLIYHVFNSDFVEENIVPNNYTPDGNIEGYVLGKAQIDLSSEKKKEEDIISQIDKRKKEIEEIVESAKTELKKHGIVSNIAEFSLIDKEKLLKSSTYSDILPFESIAEQLKTLSKTPDNLADLKLENLIYQDDFFNDIENLLTTSYSKSSWDNEFVEFYQNNRIFIESGLDMMDNSNSCPFCRHPLEDETLALIKQYSDFRNDKEASLLAEIERQSKALDDLIIKLKAKSAEINSIIVNAEKIKKYFPSLQYIEIKGFSVTDETMSCLTTVKNYLLRKTKDISFVCADAKEKIDLCKNYIKTSLYYVGNAISEIAVINRTKNNANAERLALRRNLCKAEFNKTKEKLTPLFVQFNQLNDELILLQEQIKEKENQVKISKKEKVFETLTFFLDLFFDGKYALDKETFQIKFQGNKIGDKATKILSDGEKSIVAYCYYLATTHLLVSREDDYNNLFFIIDDPISSMDFHYVYLVAQSLRDIKALFNFQKHERVWVLTHNSEFLSIITRNHIINSAFSIKPGKIEVLDHRLLLPYESHLIDIVKIARGEVLPTHTTANSIRHVIETICSFEFPEKGIENYIAENEILSKDACIFSICQDLSHGKIRKQMPFTDDILIMACNVVIDFINSKYKGQIDAIK